MTQKNAKLLYVEDDETLGFLTTDNLQREGYDIKHITNGQSALECIKSEQFDLCILDIMLPDVDGFAIAEKIRENDLQTPILFLSAKSMKEDRIKGLKLGADDYITKPFSIEELVLKIEVFLKRKSITGPDSRDKFQLASYSFDYRNLILENNEKQQKLTQREADLLRILVSDKNKIVKRSYILETLWGEDDYFMGRSLDVFISKLRKYLKEDSNISIENIHGVGFSFKEATPD